MNYCETCRLAVEGKICPVCGDDFLRPIHGKDYCFLAAKEEMWAKMLQELLQNNHIPAVLLPTLGAGISLKSGQTEQYQIFVPYEGLEQASGLLQMFFGDACPENEEANDYFPA